MMNRNSTNIPEVQVNFLQSTVKPAFTVLADIFPYNTQIPKFLEEIEKNTVQWQNLLDVKDSIKK